jgi:hypothetical protein
MHFTYCLGALLLCSVDGFESGFGYGGSVDGAVFELNLPRSTVISLLPKGLELISTSADSQPVLLTFCVQLHVGAPFTDFNYKEFILTGISFRAQPQLDLTSLSLVPYVQWDNDHAPQYKYRGPFSYLPHLYLNETEPTVLGQFWAGDDKEVATITRVQTKSGSGSFTVKGNPEHPFAGETILEASWTDGEFSNATAFPGFEANFAAGYNLPSIGRYPKDSGEWKCLPQNYHTSDIARVAPTTGHVTIHKAFMGEASMPTGIACKAHTHTHPPTHAPLHSRKDTSVLHYILHPP